MQNVLTIVSLDCEYYDINHKPDQKNNKNIELIAKTAIENSELPLSVVIYWRSMNKNFRLYE